MATVILFGGGDGGGLVIGPDGIRPIPPFDPAVMRQLRAVCELVPVAHARRIGGIRSEIGQLASKLANLAVPQVEAIVGELDEQRSVIFLDDDGGWYCGTTGQPPIPFPWPPRKGPDLDGLVTGGVIDSGMIEFLKAAGLREVPVDRILERPAAVAEELGFELGAASVRQLERLAPSRLERIADPVERETLTYFHKVVEDGRFLETWATKPADTAQQLGIRLSDAAANGLISAGASAFAGDGLDSANPIAVAVAVAIVVMLVDDVAEPSYAIADRSGRTKF
ncbi:MAG: hypothetical protein JF598_03880 [Streptomyces sp.]|jgi:hypothetical protein|nr:hypothetical protein [Streptomyces sp.]